MRLDACPGLQNRCKAGCILLPISSMHSIQERPSLENVCYTKTSTPAANATTTQPITFIWDFSTNLLKHSQSALNTVLKVQDVEHIKWIHEYSFVWGTEILMYTEILALPPILSWTLASSSSLFLPDFKHYAHLQRVQTSSFVVLLLTLKFFGACVQVEFGNTTSTSQTLTLSVGYVLNGTFKGLGTSSPTCRRT